MTKVALKNDVDYEDSSKKTRVILKIKVKNRKPIKPPISKSN